MKLVSVNVSLPKRGRHARREVATGIFKKPVRGSVMLRTPKPGREGQADLVNRGAIYRSASVYPMEHYDYWRRELGREDLTFGQFGEDFTVEGMLEDDIYIGDVFRAGHALVEVSHPRPPFFKLGIKMGMAQFPKLFLRSGRVGFYLRVLEEGEVRAGDTFELVKADPVRITVAEMSHLLFFDPENLEGAKRALRIKGLSPAWRSTFEERLIRAGIIGKHDSTL
ncbi:MAG: MOSC domain-containing protein [Actinomycetota bacterium]|nr:MOSC domain-containing protein [Actinomycetota bacterium]